MGNDFSGAMMSRTNERVVFLFISVFLILFVILLSFLENQLLSINQNYYLFTKILLTGILSVSLFFLLGQYIKNPLHKIALSTFFLITCYATYPDIKKNSKINISYNNRVAFLPEGVVINSNGKKIEPTFYIVRTMAYISKNSIEKSREATLQKETALLRIGKKLEKFIAFGRGSHFNGSTLENRRDVSEEIIEVGSKKIHDTIFYSESKMLWVYFIKLIKETTTARIDFQAIIDGKEVSNFCEFNTYELTKNPDLTTTSVSFSLTCI